MHHLQSQVPKTTLMNSINKRGKDWNRNLKDRSQLTKERSLLFQPKDLLHPARRMNQSVPRIRLQKVLKIVVRLERERALASCFAQSMVRNHRKQWTHSLRSVYLILKWKSLLPLIRILVTPNRATWILRTLWPTSLPYPKTNPQCMQSKIVRGISWNRLLSCQALENQVHNIPQVQIRAKLETRL